MQGAGRTREQGNLRGVHGAGIPQRDEPVDGYDPGGHAVRRGREAAPEQRRDVEI